ncbi:PAS domain-containing protein [bacterium]|nr:PAS domain-containing protein [bacterium]
MQHRNRFLWKLFSGYAALLLLGVLVTGVTIERRISSDALRELEAALEGKAIFLREISLKPLQGVQVAGFPAEVAELSHASGTRLTVITRAGAVLADSHEDPATMENHVSRPEIVQALNHGRGIEMRFSQTLEEQMMYVALPVVEGGETIGFVRCALPLTDVKRRLAELRAIIGIGLLVSLALSLALGWVLARRITWPLMQVTQTAELIAGGNLDERMPVQGTDEVGVLAKAVGDMAASMRERIETISRDRNRLSAILAGMAEGLVAVDAAEKVVLLNHAAGRMLGVKPEDCIGRQTYESIRISGLVEVIEHTLKHGQMTEDRLTLLDKNQDRTVDVLTSPLKEDGNRIVGVVVVLRDLTRIRHLENLRQEFVANASHELKSPLTSIRGLTDTLLDDPQMEAQTRSHFLSLIQQDTGRLSQLINDMLTLSQIESSEQTLDLRPIDLADLLRDETAALETLAQTRQIDLNADIPDTPLLVVGDDAALCEMINNLLDNALKYTAAGGQIRIRSWADGNRISFSVADTGVGIAAEHLGHIFERFYRVDKARSRELGGTGLGLAIVKHIVLAHGGEVSVTSTPGKGSTFTVQLPSCQ